MKPLRLSLLLLCTHACSKPLEGVSGTDVAVCEAPEVVVPVPDGLRRLSHSEYNNSLRDLLYASEVPVFDLVSDTKVNGFENQAELLLVSPLLVDEYHQAALTISEVARADLDRYLPCDPSDGKAACGLAFIESFGTRAFRRPLELGELVLFSEFFAEQLEQSSFREACQLVVQAMLESPQFLYRLELESTPTGETRQLDAYEVASRLSYFLWGTMPDEVLFDLAADDALQTPEQIEAAARSMMEDARARDAVVDFHRQWLAFEEVETASKNTAVYPDFDSELRQASRDELDLFVEHHIFDGAGTVRALLTGTETYVNAPLAELYGIEGVTGGWEPVHLDPSERSGILTSAGFLAGQAHQVNPSPVLRGVFVLGQVLCSPTPPPPPDVDTTVPEEVDVVGTNRDRYEQHATDAQCASCHTRIDGVGFAFENYDGVGAYRETDNGFPVDASGALQGTDVDGTVDGAVELTRLLADSRQVEECVTTQWLRFARGRTESAEESCLIASLTDELSASGGSIQELLIAIVTRPEFRMKTGESL